MGVFPAWDYEDVTIELRSPQKSAKEQHFTA